MSIAGELDEICCTKSYNYKCNFQQFSSCERTGYSFVHRDIIGGNEESSFHIVLTKKTPTPERAFRIFWEFDFSAQNTWVDAVISLQDVEHNIIHPLGYSYLTEIVNLTHKTDKFVTQSAYKPNRTLIYDELLYFHSSNEYAKSVVDVKVNTCSFRFKPYLFHVINRTYICEHAVQAWQGYLKLTPQNSWYMVSLLEPVHGITYKVQT